ncbi:uncharacterized protein LOC134530057 [Bacillus rossius redtenbacheri]|uniref:uncharacterized protein LOC134530057 n=1 Tax=Bacillus rossius redtenbacheri TaxID=93214 RepID=UPI002FDD12DE
MRADPGAQAVLVAVLSLAAILSRACALGDNSRAARRAGHGRDPFDVGPERLSHREMQLLLRREGGDEGRGVDCCPSVLEMVEPEGGKNAQDMYVLLFRDGDKRQRFYELSCRKDVEGRPCRFMDRRLHNQSRCVQKYSYSYAIVQDPETSHAHHHRHGDQNLSKSFPSFSSAAGGSSWMLDYIRIRSGCSCEVSPKPKKKRAAGKSKKARGKRLGDDSA